MTYIATVTYYNDVVEKELTVNHFIVGDSYANAVNKLINYYGEEDTESIYVEPFSPDDFLAFDKDFTDVFDAVRTKVGERVLW